jgi:hypothetical protein
VAVVSRLYEAIRTPEDLPKDFIANLTRFLDSEGPA